MTHLVSWMREAKLEPQQIEHVLIGVLEDFVQDWDVDGQITRDTHLVADLDFDSIDVIQVTVAIEKAFGTRNLGFQDLLMVDGRYVDDLSVGEIADFLGPRVRDKS